MPSILTVEATQMNLVQLLNELADGTIDAVQVMDGSDFTAGGITHEATELGLLVKESVYNDRAWLFEEQVAAEEIGVAEFAGEQTPLDKSALYAFVKKLRDIATRNAGSATAATTTIDSTPGDSDVTYDAMVPGPGSNDLRVEQTDPGGPTEPLVVTVDEDGTAASLLVDCTNPNSDVTFDAVTNGAGGNKIRITYTDPSAVDQLIDVTVIEGPDNIDIDVSLATDGVGTITSTANEVVAAIAAMPVAASYVAGTAEGTGAGVVEAKTQASLAGGYNTVINISLETDGGSLIVSTALEVATAVNAHAIASKYVTATEEGTGSGVVEAGAANLAGGATQLGQSTLTFDSTPANSDVYFTAVPYGFLGNRYSAEFLDPGDINQPLTFTQIGDKLSVSLATDGVGTITTIASDIISNWPAGWNALVTVAYEGTGGGLVEAQAEANLVGGSEHPDAAKFVPLTLAYKKDQLDITYNKIVFVGNNQNTAFAMV